MLSPTDDYSSLYASFEWRVPQFYNIGIDTCDKWADGSARLALIHETENGDVQRFSFDDLKILSAKLGNAWRAQGVEPGERVAIFLAQSPETALAHLASYKLGAIAVPLFALFGEEALAYRLGDSAASVLVTDSEGYAKIQPILDRLPALKHVYCTDLAAPPIAQEAVPGPGAMASPRLHSFWNVLESQGDAFEPVDTRADDPAVIIYTSGTTGKPKGAVLPHRALLGHLPCVEMSHDFFPQPGDLMWTPADWAWIGGLLDVLLPAWHHGIAVLARRFAKFDGTAAFELMARHRVRNTFLPPTALKMMRAADPASAWATRLDLRSVASGGEALGDELVGWGQRTLGVVINEFYGQTECNLVLSSCSKMFDRRTGFVGKTVPGHELAIVDEAGQPVACNVQGQIAVKRPDPVMFLGYWNNPAATEAKFIGDFLLTGDLGMMDEEGYVRFLGRDDDVITSAGYRIGPGPIEDCLLSHPAVRVAAVIGVPDQERTEVVKAFVVLNEGHAPSAELIAELKQHVKVRLAAHEYPRLIEFIDGLPMTPTGKIIRRQLRAKK
jgi:acetyl-CoA synthetase